MKYNSIKQKEGRVPELITVLGMSIGIFVFFLIFFYKIHPIMLYDMDDWQFSSYSRIPVPIWGDWNPTRILPEISMTAVSFLGRILFYPLMNDYFSALSLAYACSIALSMVLLSMLLYFFLRKKYNNILLNLVLVYSFLLCHFLIFNSHLENNKYMLQSIDACTYFFYVIPNIVNCALVFYLVERHVQYRDNSKDVNKEKRNIKIIQYVLIMIAIYFCMFSNAFCSIISVSYVISSFLFDVILEIIKKKFLLSKFFKRKWLELYLLGLWIVSVIFDLSGGRAGQIKGADSPLSAALERVKQVVSEINVYFVVGFVILLIVGIVIAVKKRHKELLYDNSIYALAAFIICILLFIISSRAGSFYLTRPDVLYGVFFFVMLIILTFIGIMIKKLYPGLILASLILVFLTVICNKPGKTFVESTINNIDPFICKKIDEDILMQVIKAEKEKESEMILFVPLYGTPTTGNWPLSLDAGENITNHLYNMKLTDTKMHIKEIIPTMEKNIEFGI